MDKSQLTEEDIKILQEVGSIGMGHASTALAQLLKTKINITLPDVELININEVRNFFPDSDILLGLVLRMLGDIKGNIFYLFKKEDAYKLIDTIHKTNQSGENPGLSEEIKVSTIKEVSNILSGSYLNSLSNFVSLTLLPSLPHLAMDSASSIFDLASMSDEGDTNLILIRSKLSMEGDNFFAVGSLVLELREDQLKIFLDAIKKKYKS